MKNQSLDAIIDRGLAALDNDDLGRAKAALEEARKHAGENHVRVLHLSGMVAWAHDELDQATGFLMQAVDAEPNDARIYLDCAECLLLNDQDMDDAEAAARSVLGLKGADPEAVDQARMLLAQIRLQDDDVEEALELLDAVSQERKSDPGYLSMYGFVLMNAGRAADAAGTLRRAVEVDPEDADIRYWFAQALDAVGDTVAAREQMLKVLELDAGDEDPDPVDPELADDLREQFESVLEEVPDPVLKLVASAPIVVQARPTADQVRMGADPRSAVCFLGRPQTDDADARLDSIVLMRDFLLDEIEGDDDIPELLLIGLVEEVRRFFRIDGLGVGTGLED